MSKAISDEVLPVKEVSKKDIESAAQDAAAQDYTADKIQKLEGVEAVR